MAIPPTLFGCNWRRCLANDSNRSVHIYEDTRTRKQYAVKLLNTESIEPRMAGYVKAEVMNHYKLLKHPHVVELSDVTFVAPYLCIKMELANKDLFRFLKKYGRLQEPAAQWLFLQLVHAVDYCHRKQVCNRDIKPSNILLMFSEGRSPTLKLCDFGYSKRLDEPLLSQVGTLPYLAPEVISAVHPTTAEHIPYNEKVDVWGCGVTLYCMLFNQLPFGDATTLTGQQVLSRILANDWHIPPDVPVSAACVDFLRRMIAPKEERWAIHQLWEHPWMQQNLPGNVIEFNQQLASQHTDPAATHRLESLLNSVLNRKYCDNFDTLIEEELAKVRHHSQHGTCTTGHGGQGKDAPRLHQRPVLVQR